MSTKELKILTCWSTFKVHHKATTERVRAKKSFHKSPIIDSVRIIGARGQGWEQVSSHQPTLAANTIAKSARRSSAWWACLSKYYNWLFCFRKLIIRVPSRHEFGRPNVSDEATQKQRLLAPMNLVNLRNSVLYCLPLPWKGWSFSGFTEEMVLECSDPQTNLFDWWMHWQLTSQSLSGVHCRCETSVSTNVNSAHSTMAFPDWFQRWVSDGH